MTSRLFQVIRGDDGKKSAPPRDANLTKIHKSFLWGNRFFYDFRHRFLIGIVSYEELKAIKMPDMWVAECQRNGEKTPIISFA